jgi:heme/copper-type cytochrome/quinol oxidase subunit 2
MSDLIDIAFLCLTVVFILIIWYMVWVVLRSKKRVAKIYPVQFAMRRSGKWWTRPWFLTLLIAVLTLMELWRGIRQP